MADAPKSFNPNDAIKSSAARSKEKGNTLDPKVRDEIGNKIADTNPAINSQKLIDEAEAHLKK